MATTIVPDSEVDSWWCFCVPLFSRVYKKYPEDPSLEEYYSHLKAGNLKLLIQVSDKGFCGGGLYGICDNYFTGLFGSWHMDLIDFKEFYDTIEMVAKSLSVDGVAIRGRKGYKKILEPFGFKGEYAGDNAWMFKKEL